MKKALLILMGLGLASLSYADSNSAGATPSMISNLLLLVVFLFLFYFLLIRPQTKKVKEHQALISNIAKDDEVVINGGMMGKVTKISDQFVVVEIADGIEVKVQKQAISSSVPKGTIKSI